MLSLGLQLRGSALPYWCGFVETKALKLVPRVGSKAVHVLPQVRQRSSPYRRLIASELLLTRSASSMVRMSVSGK